MTSDYLPLPYTQGQHNLMRATFGYPPLTDSQYQAYRRRIAEQRALLTRIWGLSGEGK